MQPSIGQSIARGFATAMKGWAGVGLYAAGTVVIGLVVFGAIMATGVPQEVLEGPPVQDFGAFPTAGTASTVFTPPSESAETFGEAAPATDAAGEAVEALAEEAAVPTDTAVDSAAGALAGDDSLDALGGADALYGEDYGTGQSYAAWEDAVVGWLTRAWPMIFLALIVALVAGLWLNGGQIGYVGGLEATQKSNVKLFLQSANAAWLRLLGAWAISTGAVVAASLLMGVVAFLLSLMTALPEWLVVIFAVLFGVAAMVGLIWLAIRLVFWFPAMVLDGIGPIAALKASFRLTNGSWWRVFGLGVVVALLSLAVSLVFQLLGVAAAAIPGAFGAVIGTIIALIGQVATLFLGFALLGAYIHFYRGLKNAGGASA